MGKKKARSWTEADEQREVKKRLKQDERLAKHRPAPGAPDIAHPGEKGEYERQLAFIASWFFEMWKRIELNDEKPGKPGNEARCELQKLLLNTIGQVLRTALKSRRRPKKWAGQLLAIIGSSIGKYDEKLCVTNTAYRKEKAKIGKVRTDVLFPRSAIAKVVKRELKQALRFRKRLLLLKKTCVTERKQKQLGSATIETGRTWEPAALEEGIPRECWPLMKLPEFKVKSEPQWWKFLWPLLKKNNPDLLEKLRGEAKRKEVVWTHLDGSSKRQVKSRKLFWKDFQRQFRNHLKALAGQGVR